MLYHSSYFFHFIMDSHIQAFRHIIFLFRHLKSSRIKLKHNNQTLIKIKVHFFSLLKEAMDISGKQEDKERDRVMVGMMGKYIYMMREQPEENTPERVCVCVWIRGQRSTTHTKYITPKNTYNAYQPWKIDIPPHHSC